MARLAYVKSRERKKLADEINSLGARSPINQIRKALFGTIKVRDKGRIRNSCLFYVYLDKTSDDAARGSVDAMRQVNWLIQIFVEKSILHAPEAEHPEIEATKKVLERNKSISEQFDNQMARICVGMMPDFQRAYGEARPELDPIPPAVPYEWRSEFAQLAPEVRYDAARRIAATRRREAGASEVGYCKPPVRTRWKPGQSGNPSGRRREGHDVWEPYRKAMMKIICLSSGGRSSKSTSIAVAVRQLFTEAMKGTLGAHQQVKKLLMMLDKLNLLSPPPKVKRRSRRCTPPEKADLIAKRERVWTRLLPSVKARMLEEFERVYGKVPPFETRLERHLAARASPPVSRTRIRTRSRPPVPSKTVATSILEASPLSIASEMARSEGTQDD